MLVKIKNVKVFQSLHGGHDCFRVDGLHQDETGEWVEGRTFVDPRMDNAGNWLEICEVGLSGWWLVVVDCRLCWCSCAQTVIARVVRMAVTERE